MQSQSHFTSLADLCLLRFPWCSAGTLCYFINKKQSPLPEFFHFTKYVRPTRTTIKSQQHRRLTAVLRRKKKLGLYLWDGEAHGLPSSPSAFQWCLEVYLIIRQTHRSPYFICAVVHLVDTDIHRLSLGWYCTSLLCVLTVTNRTGLRVYYKTDSSGSQFWLDKQDLKLLENNWCPASTVWPHIRSPY